MDGARDRPDPACPPARCHPGRRLRPADAAEGTAAAADAGPRQPAFPPALPGHRRGGADAPPRPLRGRLGAAERRPLARAGRPHRGAGRYRLCAGDAPGAGAQPARGLPFHSGAAPQALRRPLARFAAGDGTRRRRPSEHGRADAGVAVSDLFRARLSRPRVGRAAGRRRRSGGARWPGLAKNPGRVAAGPHAAAPPRQRLRRSAGIACRFGARRHRSGRGDAQRSHRAGERPGLGRRRDPGPDALPRTPVRTPAQPATRSTVARRVVAGRVLGRSLRPGQPRHHDRAPLPRRRSRADRGRHAGTGRAQGPGGADSLPARPVRGPASVHTLAQSTLGRPGPDAGGGRDARVRERRGRRLPRAAGRPGA